MLLLISSFNSKFRTDKPILFSRSSKIVTRKFEAADICVPYLSFLERNKIRTKIYTNEEIRKRKKKSRID